MMHFFSNTDLIVMSCIVMYVLITLVLFCLILNYFSEESEDGESR